MQDQKLTQDDREAIFRESCVFTVNIARALAPFCKSIEDLVEMVGLATESDGQLKLLFNLVTPKQPK